MDLKSSAYIETNKRIGDMAKIGIGIIGTGSIANTYVQCISELEDANLVAMFTNSQERVREMQENFGVPVFSDMDKFLNNPEITLVCVCNRSGDHGVGIIASALAGKHVLTEKPIEVNTEKVDEAIAACTAQNVLLGCVFQNRCSTDYQAVYKAVKDGLLGKLVMGNAHINWYRNKDYYKTNPWRGTLKLDGGAAFINQGIHTIDLLLHVMGPVTSVFGTVRTIVHEIEGEDAGAGVLHFENGAIGTITAGTALYPGYPERLEIYGEKGSILMEGGKITHWNIEGQEAPFEIKKSGAASGASDPTSIGHLNHKIVLGDMLDAIENNRPPMVDGAEARKSVAVITALYQSSKEGKMIRVV